MTVYRLAGVLLLLTAFACAQSTVEPSDPASSLPATRLGIDDLVQVRVVDSEELADKSVRIGRDGTIVLPTVGRMQAAGLTVDELRTNIEQRMKRLLFAPDVSVSLMETHSQPVSVMGAVRSPGVFQLQGPKTLLEILSMAGGPRDDAGYMAQITRRQDVGALPLPGVMADSSGAFWIAELDWQRVMDARNPEANILILPNDVVTVSKADMVYVIGDVLKPGTIIVGDQKSVTAMQAISIVSGLGKTAKATDARILRLVPGTIKRTEVAVNLKEMFAGKIDDIALKPNDILFVPTSLKKDLGYKTLEALGGGVTGALYRIP